METQLRPGPSPHVDSDTLDDIPDAGSSGARQGRVAKPKPGVSCRRKREFISDDHKDASYWEKRRKNNEAAKRSREKRRVNDMVLENRVMALNEENLRLKTEILQLKLRFGLISAASHTEKLSRVSSATTEHQVFLSTHALMNSDSSEAEKFTQSECQVLLSNCSSQGSLSDFSDRSSPDCLEPPNYKLKPESSDVHEQAHQSNVQEQQPASNQRSVILYSSSSKVSQNQADPKLVVPLRPYALETLSEVAQQLASRSLDTDVHHNLPDHHLPDEAYPQNICPTNPPALTHKDHLRHDRFPCKDTSSSDGDPHSSDKEASTDDESLSSLSSETSRRSHAGQNRGDVKAAALPHKLRLKHRAVCKEETSHDASVSSGCRQSGDNICQCADVPPEPSPCRRLKLRGGGNKNPD
ncbi:nuclear factor, interleukin 3 regulated, member 5 [Clarias gariepinus]|uniref:nuclear factor, interleukin 3 regulated, member 5 n=1 Tax=Clarias gariepinus TaxID=13013 RepID=UPI00234C9340|nr:nuclear factor, interleukin 3 regulated, member 5 [Clarias gariepinus]